MVSVSIMEGDDIMLTDETLIDRMYSDYTKFKNSRPPFTPAIATWKRWIRTV